MKIQSLQAFLFLCITALSFPSFAVDVRCTLESPEKAKPPTATIFPDGEVDGWVPVEFRIPSFVPGKPDQLKRLKIKDVDGSASLMMTIYLAQNSDIPSSYDEALLKALRKRQEFWQEDLAKQYAKPVIKPNSGVDPVLIEQSLGLNKHILTHTKENILTDENRKQIISQVLEPFIAYDTVMTYSYKEFVDGKYVDKGAKRLKDIFPPEFYDVASSPKTAGALKDKKAPGVSSCEYLPVYGRMPKAGVPQRRPGQR